LIVNPTKSKVFVDGREIVFEAYNINGSNYFKLREIGAAVGFSVEWSSIDDSIYINTNDTVVSVVSIEEMKDEIVRLTNIEREKAGVPKVKVLPELMITAQLKADDMFVNHYYGHNSPEYGSMGDMIKSFIPNTAARAENLAPWTKTSEDAFIGWVESPEHYKIMINPIYTHIGVGVAEGANGGYWWV